MMRRTWWLNIQAHRRMTADAPSVLHRSDLRIRPDDVRRLFADANPSVEAKANHLSSGGGPRCGACHDVIGVYEPIVRVIDGSVHHTSRAAEPRLPQTGERWYHLGCYESLDDEQ
jgi:hypothetical protein